MAGVKNNCECCGQALWDGAAKCPKCGAKDGDPGYHHVYSDPQSVPVDKKLCGDALGVINKEFAEIHERLKKLEGSGIGGMFLPKPDDIPNQEEVNKAFETLWVALRFNQEVYDDVLGKITETLNNAWMDRDLIEYGGCEVVAKRILKKMFGDV